MPAPGWYVVNAHSGQEGRAVTHLGRQRFVVYLPIDPTGAPYFPRYLFIWLDLERQQWRPVISTCGVRSIVGYGDRPSRCPDGLVEEVRARVEALVPMSPAALPSCPFKPGQEVEMNGRCFFRHRAIFECRTAIDRVRVLLEIMGGRRGLEVPLSCVAAA
jgi:transcriptional antiterminator RfaH